MSKSKQTEQTNYLLSPPVSSAACIERSLGRVFRGDDTWLRSAGRRVEFCRCADGKSKCHSVPVMGKGRIKSVANTSSDE